MGLKDQFVKLKDNWLIILLVVVLALFMMGGGNLLGTGASLGKSYDLAESAYRSGAYPSPYPSDDGFAPEVEERIIVKSASLATEIERGGYDAAHAQLMSIVDGSSSIVLDENVNRYGEIGKDHRQGSYQIKVPVQRYDGVVAQLRAIGTEQSFHENAQDITGSYVDLQTELSAEQERLDRYEQMLEKATGVGDQITLSDRIADQQRRVAYLQDRIKNADTRVDYASVSVRLNEEPSAYQGIALVTFGTLWRNLVQSLNALFEVTFTLLPWAAAAGIIWILVRIFRRKA